MSEVNFLSSDQEEKKIRKTEDDVPAVKWTDPGVLPKKEKNSVKKKVEDIFADTDIGKTSLTDDSAPTIKQVETKSAENSLFAQFKNIFLKSGNDNMFKKHKEALRDYQDVLQSENASRSGSSRSEDKAAPKREFGGKPYFRRDEWHAPNVIKTNLIQKEIGSVLDWQDNISIMMLGVFSACLVLAISYLGLELKESLAAQKNQQTIQEIQDVKMQIVSLKSGLGDIDTFQKKLAIANSLLKEHVYWTNFFKFWEDNLLKNVYFSGDFSGSINGEYNFSALTDSYTNAANQIRLLREGNDKGFIKELVVNQASYSSNEKQSIAEATNKKGIESVVSFGLVVKMDPKIFYKNN